MLLTERLRNQHLQSTTFIATNVNFLAKAQQSNK